MKFVGKIKMITISSLMTAGLAGCSGDMELLGEDQTLYGACHNIYQTLVEGKPQAMVRADAVFVSEAGDGAELILRKGEEGLEADMSGCDEASKKMFDQLVEYVEGPPGRALKKVIR